MRPSIHRCTAAEHDAVVRAEAALSAAAPRLLEACKAFLDVWHRAGPLGSHQFEKFDHAVRLAEAAIAEAETIP